MRQDKFSNAHLILYACGIIPVAVSYTHLMFTEKYGTHQCMLAVRENVMRTHHATVDDAIINRVLRFGTAATLFLCLIHL